MNKFPADTEKRQHKDMKPCCISKNMREYDCGCSWGCISCWASYECVVCGRLYSHKFVHKGIMKNYFIFDDNGHLKRNSLKDS